MRTFRRGQPHFDIDLKWGQEAERKIKKLFRCFVSDDPRVEVKRKSYLDLKFYIEMECDKGATGVYEPSGIQVTRAELYAFVIDDSGVYVLIPTAFVRAALSEPTSVNRAAHDGECPTRGKLIDFMVLLHRLQQRWKNPAPPVAAPPVDDQAAESLSSFNADSVYRW